MNGEKKNKDWTKTKAYRQLKKGMLDNLEARGLTGPMYTDKVEEYMRMWCILNLLNDDVMERGVVVAYQNGERQKGVTDNKSLQGAVRVSNQMLAIWTALGFRDQAIKAGPAAGGDEDDL